MHKAWSSIEEVPYCFWRSSVKFQGHSAKKNRRFSLKLGVSRLKNRWFESNLSKIARPVAAIKSLRFALFVIHMLVISHFYIETTAEFIQQMSKNVFHQQTYQYPWKFELWYFFKWCVYSEILIIMKNFCRRCEEQMGFILAFDETKYHQIMCVWRAVCLYILVHV